MLSNKDFVSLIPSKSSTSTGSSKQRFSLDEVAALDKQNNTFKQGKKSEYIGKHGRKSEEEVPSSSSTSIKGPTYRDRAAERRVLETVELTSTTLPSSNETIALQEDFVYTSVKGLDFARLQKSRDDQSATFSVDSEYIIPSKHGNTELGRSIANVLFHPNQSKPNVKRIDTIGRQVYEFDVSTNEQCIPTIVTRSKLEMNRSEEFVICSTPSWVLEKLSQALGKKGKRKRADLAAAAAASSVITQSNTSNANIASMKVVVDSIGDIFEGVGKYSSHDSTTTTQITGPVVTSFYSSKMVDESVDLPVYVPTSLQDIVPSQLRGLGKLHTDEGNKDILKSVVPSKPGVNVGYRLDHGSYDDDIYAIRQNLSLDASDDDMDGDDDVGGGSASKKSSKKADNVGKISYAAKGGSSRSERRQKK